MAIFRHERTPSFLFAMLIAGIGLTLAFRSLWPILRGTPRRSQIPVVLTDLERSLNASLLDTDPSEVGIQRIMDMTRARLRSRLHESPPKIVTTQVRRDDLALALIERVQATIDGDFDRDSAARTARGKPPPDRPVSKEVLDYWRGPADWTRGARLGLENLEIRTIFARGVRMTPEPLDEGYSASISTETGEASFPLAKDPVEARLDIVEVRLPMGIRPIKGSSRGAVLVGYQFGWSTTRHQWIPFANVVYKPPGEIYAALPF